LCTLLVRKKAYLSHLCYFFTQTLNLGTGKNKGFPASRETAKRSQKQGLKTREIHTPAEQNFYTAIFENKYFIRQYGHGAFRSQKPGF